MVKRLNPKLQRLTALALLGCVLLTFPMIGLSHGFWGGFPAVYVYLFGVWFVLIVLVALTIEKRGK